MTFDQTINQVPEVNIESLLASFRDGGAEAPEDSEDEDDLHVDGVDLGPTLLESGDVHDSGEKLGQTPE